MTTRMQDPLTLDRTVIGTAGVVLGALALAAVAWIAFLTFGTADVPQWLRVAGSAFLPLGLAGAVGAGLIAPPGPARRRAWLGMALAAVAALTLVVMLVAVGG
ncbi:MAG: hypothetical protein H5T83_04505 [Actinotalea sp.]|nr:hypothetical protein [Actinotalea sp.]